MTSTDRILLRVILQAIGFSGAGLLAVSCGGGVVVDGSSGGSASSGSSGSGSSGAPVMCGETPGFGEFVTVCLPMDGDFCRPASWPTVLDDLAKKQGVCAEHNFGDCCNVAALGNPVCDLPPGVNDCCYQAVAMDFGVCIGRPFFVEGAPRTAQAEIRSDWQSIRNNFNSSELDSITRAALAEGWKRQARDEHASVAAFARLVLELLSVGAPSALVRGAQEAMGDEIEHAELSFAVASQFAQESLGPGTLPVDGALGRTALEDIALSAVREGCVGETIGAALARDAASACENDELKQVLLRIADDEMSHAALSFQIVAFALKCDPKLRGAVAQAFAEEPVWPFARRMPGLDEAAYRAHGQWLPEDARAIAARTLELVVKPCAAALLDSVGIG